MADGDTSTQHLHPRSASEHLLAQPIASDANVSINVTDEHETRPPPVKHLYVSAIDM